MKIGSSAISYRSLGLILGLSPIIASAPARAADESNGENWIELGLYLPNVDSLVQVDNSQTGQSGTLLDLEDDLDLGKRKSLPSVSAGISISKSFDLVADIYQLNRRNSVQIDEAIDYDGVTYPVNATLESQFDSRVYRLAVSYNILRSESSKIGLSLGAHITDFKTSLAGDIRNPDGSVQFVRNSRKLLAPLPTLGVSASTKIADKVRLSVRADALSLKIGDYKGRLLNTQVSAAYRMARNWDIGVMYRYVDYRLRVRKSDWIGRVRYDFKGPAAFLRWNW